jgi:hypothetical protein
MKNIEKLRFLAVVSCVATLLLGAGCSDDSDDENPSPGTNVIGGTKGDGGKGGTAGKGNTAGSGGSSTDGGTDPGTAGTGTEGGNAPVAGAGGDAGGGPIDECKLEPTGADGCFNCPTTDAEFHNRCADGTCVPFDNKRLTKLNPDGSLPELDQ